MPDSLNHPVTVRQLPNGIRLVLVPLAGTAAVTSYVFFGVGSRYEGEDQQGLAHFTEHMVFKGGEKYPTAQAIAQSMDAVGGEFNAFTSQEYTGFYTKTAAAHYERGLDVLSDMLLRATFAEAELAKEKGVIVEELNMYEDIPMRKVDQVLSKLVFGDTPLGRPIIGTKESVTAFTPADFQRYRSMFYLGERCVIVMAGDLDVEAATETVARYFQDLPRGESYRPQPAQFQEGSERVRIEHKKSEQTHLMLGVRTLPLNHPDRYIARLLTIILGGNMSSRLFTSVREQQGLCYYVRAVPDSYVDEGLMVASAGVDNTRLHQAVAAIVREMQILRDEPVSPQELDRAQQFLLGKMLLSLEDSEEVAELYGMQQLLENKTEPLDHIRQRILDVTADQIQQAARTYFTDARARMAVIGPQEEPEKLQELLHFTI
jgi:predicted Zn-dependent peptidase